MARMRHARFKKCRSLGLNVCGHPKAMKRADNGQSREKRNFSPYGIQLLEKQRLKCYYEVMEKQFRRYVKAAINDNEVTGDSLVRQLECRLDNMVYRMNFGSSIREARQMVTHGHIRVNARKVDIPSFSVSVGDVVSLREKSRKNEVYKENFLEKAFNTVDYIDIDKDNFSATLVRNPERQEVPIEIRDHLIVELYSKIM
ncbi:MAG: 30S ribosomal protein S4 [Alkaliphilus sp.]